MAKIEQDNRILAELEHPPRALTTVTSQHQQQQLSAMTSQQMAQQLSHSSSGHALADMIAMSSGSPLPSRAAMGVSGLSGTVSGTVTGAGPGQPLCQSSTMPVLSSAHNSYGCPPPGSASYSLGLSGGPVPHSSAAYSYPTTMTGLMGIGSSSLGYGASSALTQSLVGAANSSAPSALTGGVGSYYSTVYTSGAQQTQPSSLLPQTLTAQASSMNVKLKPLEEMELGVSRYATGQSVEGAEGELALCAGDYLLVWGHGEPTGGYLDGELLDGRRGLVPAHFVQRLIGDDLLEFHQAVVSTLREADDAPCEPAPLPPLPPLSQCPPLPSAGLGTSVVPQLPPCDITGRHPVAGLDQTHMPTDPAASGAQDQDELDT
ncbi:flocculation protein FLO11-like, partial [Ctenocephalides felis]|uniref:flocculation protein FLO11-like n=1 Tax=Ctenocephalides felis TaxID=7515 RepID=UPI000E6E42D6